MSEEEFLRSTPGKVGKLFELHEKYREINQLNYNGEIKEQEERVCIDEVPFL